MAPGSGKTPVHHLKIGPEGAQIRATTADELPAEFQALRERNANDPVWQKHLERFREVAARGRAPLAILDEPLPEGAIARATVDPGASPSRLVVVSRLGLNDEILARAWQMLLSYEVQTPDSDARVELTLWPGGRLRTVCDGDAAERQVHIVVHGLDGTQRAAALLELLATTPVTCVRGVGMARLIGEKAP